MTPLPKNKNLEQLSMPTNVKKPYIHISSPWPVNKKAYFIVISATISWTFVLTTLSLF